jgi:hypothetical protein
VEAVICIVDHIEIAGNMASMDTGESQENATISFIVLVGVVSRCCANIEHMSRRSFYLYGLCRESKLLGWLSVDESSIKDGS